MEEGFLRRRSETVSPTSTVGYRYRFHKRRPEDIRLQNLSIVIGRTGETRRLHQGESGERIHSTFQISVLVTILLCGQERQQTPTSRGLQKAQFLHYP